MRFDRKQLLLYGVTDRSWLNGETLYSQVEKAFGAGIFRGGKRDTKIVQGVQGTIYH